MDRIRVLIADDHSIVRMGLSSLLETSGKIEVVGEAVDGADAVRKAVRLKPDVIVMDLVMPRKNGVAATEEIRALPPGTRILLLTTFGTSDDISRALKAGAHGAILKSASNRDLLSTVLAIARGREVISPEVEQLLASDPPLPELSQRQREILDSISRGLTNKDIACELKISLESVKSHIKIILEKLGAASRTEAAARAARALSSGRTA